MAKATKAAAAKALTPAEATPKPRLVGEDGAAGVVLPAQDEANTDRLTVLEDKVMRLAIVLTGKGFAPGEENRSESPIDTAMRAIGELSGRCDNLLTEYQELADGEKLMRDALERLTARAQALIGNDFSSASPADTVTVVIHVLDKYEDLSGQIGRLADCLMASHSAAIEGGAVDTAIKVIGDLDAQVAELTADPGAAAAIEARKAHARAERGEVAVLAELPATAALTLRFAEDDDRFIATIAPIPIDRGQLSAFGGRGVLDRDIDFGPETAPALIKSAWLIAGAKSVKCEISGGIRVGGGNIVKIPKGHLIF